MSDWLQGNLGRLNASIQAQAEAAKVQESKKNRLASIAEGLTNNLFKRQSETAAQQHERKMQNLMYGTGAYGEEGTPNPSGTNVGLATGSQMKIGQQNADLEAAARSRTYEEYINTMKRMGKTPGLSQQDWFMNWAPPNYYDKYNDKDNGNIMFLLDAAVKSTFNDPTYATKDEKGLNTISPASFVDPTTGKIDETKREKAKGALTKFLTEHASTDSSLSRLFPPEVRQAAIKTYVDTVFNFPEGQAAVGASPRINKYYPSPSAGDWAKALTMGAASPSMTGTYLNLSKGLAMTKPEEQKKMLADRMNIISSLFKSMNPSDAQKLSQTDSATLQKALNGIDPGNVEEESADINAYDKLIEKIRGMMNIPSQYK